MIGTAAALIGSAVIGGVTSSMAASKNKKAINASTAAETAANQQAIAAQERARSENLALQAPIYAAGMPAIQARNALLGLGGTQQQPMGQQSLPTAQPNALAQFQGYNPDTSGSSRGYAETRGGDPIYFGPGANANPGYLGAGTPVGDQQSPQGQTAQQAAGNAFDMFRNSTGYQFRLGEANRMFSGAAAGNGWLQSGAALKRRDQLNQDYASNEFGNYFGMLGEQQNLTAGAANAMSGVNTTYANNAGNLAVANGQILSNAAVAKANNSNALLGSLGNAAGGILGYYGGFGR